MTIQTRIMPEDQTTDTDRRRPLAEMFDAMQPYGLTVDTFLSHAARWHPATEVVSCDIDGSSSRMAYVQVLERSRRLSGALRRLP